MISTDKRRRARNAVAALAATLGLALGLAACSLPGQREAALAPAIQLPHPAARVEALSLDLDEDGRGRLAYSLRCTRAGHYTEAAVSYQPEKGEETELARYRDVRCGAAGEEVGTRVLSELGNLRRGQAFTISLEIRPAASPALRSEMKESTVYTMGADGKLRAGLAGG